MSVTMSKKSGSKGAVKKMRTTAIKTAYTKSQLVSELAMTSGLEKKTVSCMLDGLATIMHRHLKKGGAGHFTLAGLMKLQVVKKPARKAGKGRNPFTGEEIMLKAKPASRSVKVRALKKLKEMADS